MNRGKEFKYFLVTILFLTPLFFFSFVLQNIKDNFKNKNSPVINPRSEILIVGDSHFANGIDPEVLGNATNFSGYGESYIHNFYKLKYVIERKNSIKTVILPIDLYSLNGKRKKNFIVNGYWGKYIDFIELGKIIGKSIEFFIYKHFDLDFFDYRGEYITIFKSIFKNSRNKKVGYINNFKGIKNQYFHKNRDRKGEKRARRHFLGSNWLDHQLLFFLKKIIILCKEKKINLVLIKSPLTSNYYKYATMMVPEKEYYKITNNMIAEFGNPKLIDYHDIFFGKEAWKFYDSEHLNKKGAEIFTNILKNDLIKAGVIK